MVSETVGLKNFTRLKRIGDGGFGVVYEAAYKFGPKKGLLVALKASSQRSESELVARNEQTILIKLKNASNIIQLLASFAENDCLWLVLEHAQLGDVAHHLPTGGFNETCCRYILRSCAEALAHLEFKNIVHRDIKPENILIMQNGEIKLADFGLSMEVPEKNLTRFGGTIRYMAPEVLVHSSLGRYLAEAMPPTYNHRADWFSLGLVGFALRSGSPISGSERYRPKENTLVSSSSVCNGCSMLLNFPSGTTDHYQNFIGDLTALHPRCRQRLFPDVSYILKNTFLSTPAPSSKPPCSFLKHLKNHKWRESNRNYETKTFNYVRSN